MTEKELVDDGWSPKLCKIGTLFFKGTFFCHLDNGSVVLYSNNNDMVPLGVAKDFSEIKELQKKSDLNDLTSVLSLYNQMKERFELTYGIKNTDKYLDIFIFEDNFPSTGCIQCKYQIFIGNRFTQSNEMGMAIIYKNIGAENFIEFAKPERDDNSVRILIFKIDKLLSGDTAVKSFRWSINEDSIPYSEFSIFAIFDNDNFTKMDDAVEEYIGGRAYEEFEDYDRDNPWLRLIAIKKV